MQLHISKNLNDLTREYIQWLINYIKDTLKTKERFTIALSGGSTPQKLFELLSVSPFKEQIDWQSMHVFWGDERAVPFDDPRNNGKMAYDILLKNVPIPDTQVHYMQTNIPPEASADEYEKILHEYFGDKGPSFDLVILGMGDDGHTLSLFPGMTKVIHEKQKWALSYYVPAQKMYRITLTLPIVNRSRNITFLVSGDKKADTLKKVLEGSYQPDTYPSQNIKPEDGKLHWFVDEAAASKLTQHQ
jgi:6-phosphogluconolactonase